jgi:hypothetical protein
MSEIQKNIINGGMVGIQNAGAIRNELNRLGGDWHAAVVGPAYTKEAMKARNEDWNKLIEKVGCPRLRPFQTGTDGQEFVGVPPPLALIENGDAGLYTNDDGQGIILKAPATWYYDMPVGTAFLNNVLTNAGNANEAFMQNGFWFPPNTNVFAVVLGYPLYVLTHSNFVGTYYQGAVYIPGHNYEFIIDHTVVWQLCYRDLADISTYQCQLDDRALGTHLGAGINTSIWVENLNPNALWYTGFTDFQAFGAKTFVNGLPRNWAFQHRHTSHDCATSYPVANAISGSLTLGRTATFLLPGVPLNCP